MNKALKTRLGALFTASERPEVRDVNRNDNKVLVDLFVPAQLSWFDGHFPDQKVLPGVVQVDWAGKIAKELLVDVGQFSKLSNVKFKNMVLPDTHLQLELVFQPAKSTLKFHFYNDDLSFSSGSFSYIEPATKS